MAKAPKSDKSQAEPKPSPRAAIIAAFMGLLAEKKPGEIGLNEIADRAGVSLAELRGQFGSWFDIVTAFVKSVDEEVLAGIDVSLADEPVKEKLFDILMRRLDVLAPHKAAIENLGKAAARDGGLALGLNRLAVRSHQWMLAAAGVETSGPGGRLRAQGMAAMFGQVVSVWVKDEDPGLAPTMKALDEGLIRAGRAVRVLNDIERLTSPLKTIACGLRGPGFRSWRNDRWGSRRDERDGEPVPRSWRGDDFRDPAVTPV